ncbi:hypothetical protein ACPPVU_16150 [Mucilaginibacter sp. McL0603]|uniref:hypothetical protein n=1 Tax=Mucilaginibacter sp. McL0603 TaxID=3415670 RepID=UPI003CF4C484
MEQVVKDIRLAQATAYNDHESIVLKIWEKVDAWITWFVGFSIGGLALLAGNLDKLSCKIPKDDIHLIFIWLFISILSGVFYRYVYLWFYRSLLLIHFRLRMDFTSTAYFPPFPVLTRNESFFELVILIKEYTGQDFSNLLQSFMDADQERRSLIFAFLNDFYAKSELNYERQKSEVLNHIKERFQVYHGKSIDSVEDKVRFKRLYGCIYWLIVTIGGLLFFAFTISFIIALCVFCFNVHA